jgi:hypothetical protein
MLSTFIFITWGFPEENIQFLLKENKSEMKMSGKKISTDSKALLISKEIKSDLWKFNFRKMLFCCCLGVGGKRGEEGRQIKVIVNAAG